LIIYLVNSIFSTFCQEKKTRRHNVLERPRDKFSGLVAGAKRPSTTASPVVFAAY